MERQTPTAVLLQGILRLGSRLRHDRPEGSLSPNKIAVLSHLRRRGPTSPGTIAAAEHQQPQSLTRVFAELEHDGLLVRAVSEEDRRGLVLSITDEGRDTLSRDMAHRAAWLGNALLELTEVERQMLLLAGQLMNKIADSPSAPERG
ncbi:MarR family transcriptional regulator [Amycolatopsis sp.]|uniref:MarR family winged helix-turn-helix transcriptional regulator n=1 Tax=Amycolatopsis sp. TaxID=37632 RepID=UPI0026276C3D|nr:MarR family transcriptional regulator [Amycolatopsis sp.]